MGGGAVGAVGARVVVEGLVAEEATAAAAERVVAAAERVAAAVAAANSAMDAAVAREAVG